jgi:hypothetical protein
MEILPKYTFENKQELLGVFKVALMLTELGFIFRQTSNTDVGIDGQIEYVNSAGEATGKIVAVQIKSGDSYLKENKEDKDNWIFYPSEKHKVYWEMFPIPVILLVYSPSRDKIYFIDIRYYLKVNGLGSIRIPKDNTLNETTKNKLFNTVGNFFEPFLEIKDIFNTMVRKHWKSASFNLSYLDLYLQGLTNICQQIYFDISIAMDIVECRSSYIVGGEQEYTFLFEYIEFIVSQNLAEVDFGSCLIEWNERQLIPRFLATITHRGKALISFINDIEAMHLTTMPETHLVQERFLQLTFDDYSFLRIKKAQEIQELIRKDVSV